jgi:hypothetical protein
VDEFQTLRLNRDRPGSAEDGAARACRTDRAWRGPYRQARPSPSNAARPVLSRLGDADVRWLLAYDAPHG